MAQFKVTATFVEDRRVFFYKEAGYRKQCSGFAEFFPIDDH